eukprot:gene29875-biopygen11611
MSSQITTETRCHGSTVCGRCHNTVLSCNPTTIVSGNSCFNACNVHYAVVEEVATRCAGGLNSPCTNHSKSSSPATKILPLDKCHIYACDDHRNQVFTNLIGENVDYIIHNVRLTVPHVENDMDMLVDEINTLKLAFQHQILTQYAELKNVKAEHNALLKKHQFLLKNVMHQRIPDASHEKLRIPDAYHEKLWIPDASYEKLRIPDEKSADPGLLKSLEKRLLIADATAIYNTVRGGGDATLRAYLDNPYLDHVVSHIMANVRANSDPRFGDVLNGRVSRERVYKMLLAMHEQPLSDKALRALDVVVGPNDKNAIVVSDHVSLQHFTSAAMRFFASEGSVAYRRMGVRYVQQTTSSDVLLNAWSVNPFEPQLPLVERGDEDPDAWSSSSSRLNVAESPFEFETIGDLLTWGIDKSSRLMVVNFATIEDVLGKSKHKSSPSRGFVLKYFPLTPSRVGTTTTTTTSSSSVGPGVIIAPNPSNPLVEVVSIEVRSVVAVARASPSFYRMLPSIRGLFSDTIPAIFGRLMSGSGDLKDLHAVQLMNGVVDNLGRSVSLKVRRSTVYEDPAMFRQVFRWLRRPPSSDCRMRAFVSLDSVGGGVAIVSFDDDLSVNVSFQRIPDASRIPDAVRLVNMVCIGEANDALDRIDCPVRVRPLVSVGDSSLEWDARDSRYVISVEDRRGEHGKLVNDLREDILNFDAITPPSKSQLLSYRGVSGYTDPRNLFKAVANMRQLSKTDAVRLIRSRFDHLTQDQCEEAIDADRSSSDASSVVSALTLEPMLQVQSRGAFSYSITLENARPHVMMRIAGIIGRGRLGALHSVLVSSQDDEDHTSIIVRVGSSGTPLDTSLLRALADVYTSGDVRVFLLSVHDVLVKSPGIFVAMGDGYVCSRFMRGGDARDTLSSPSIFEAFLVHMRSGSYATIFGLDRILLPWLGKVSRSQLLKEYDSESVDATWAALIRELCIFGAFSRFLVALEEDNNLALSRPDVDAIADLMGTITGRLTVTLSVGGGCVSRRRSSRDKDTDETKISTRELYNNVNSECEGDAEGEDSEAEGDAEGEDSEGGGDAEGDAEGEDSGAEGEDSEGEGDAKGEDSEGEGDAEGEDSGAEGEDSGAEGEDSGAEGENSGAEGEDSGAEGDAEGNLDTKGDADASSSQVSAGPYLLDDFKSDVCTWIELDDSIKTLQHAIRDRRLEKQKLTQRIIGFMDHHDIEDLNTKSGRIRYKTKYVRPQVSKTNIRDRISSFFPNDAQFADDIVTAIYSSREDPEIDDTVVDDSSRPPGDAYMQRRCISVVPELCNIHANTFSETTGGKTDFGVVVNMDPSWMGGSHWAAMYGCIDRSKPHRYGLYYYDSLGKEPPAPILQFMKRFVAGTDVPIGWNTIQKQYGDSDTLNTNVLVHEFGLLRHASKSFLGASPDGVTEDGVMLEIKCPWRRKIDGTVPMQYYLQIQGQLAVSGLLECDYFEVEFDILQSEEEIEAEFAEISRDESIMKSAFRGVFVEKIKHGSNEPPSYVYPPCFGRDNHIVGGGKSDSSPQSLLDHLREFVDAESSSLDDSYRVNIIWWKVRKHSTVKVHADTDFSARMIDTLEGVWNDVTCLRFDKDMYDQRMLDLAPVRRSASSSATVSKRGKRPPLGNKVVCSPELARGYAFLEDANDF